MIHSQKVGIELYENLGKLFYSVAKADGLVHKKELEELKDIVEKDWLKVDEIEDVFHSDAALQIITVFDWLLEHEISSDVCFKQFSDFYKAHKSIFNRKIKDLIMQSANAIAFSYAQKNKAELISVAKIGLLFKE